MSIGRAVPRLGSVQLVGALAVTAALIAATGVVAHASSAALAPTTAPAATGWTRGAISLGDDDAGSAMFAAPNLAPGATGSRCIAVDATAPGSEVRLYGAAFSSRRGMARWVHLTIARGTGGSFAGGCGHFVADTTVYRGTLASFAARATGFSTGLGARSTAGGRHTYRFDYAVDRSAPNSVQGGSASLDFVWEAQRS